MEQTPPARSRLLPDMFLVGRLPVATSFQGTISLAMTYMSAAAKSSPATLEEARFPGVSTVHYNLLEPADGKMPAARAQVNSAVAARCLVNTGKHTGSPPAATSSWSASPRSTARSGGDQRRDGAGHLPPARGYHAPISQGGELFVQDLTLRADPDYRLNVRVITELARHGLHPRPAAPPVDGGGTGWLPAGIHHPQPPDLPAADPAALAEPPQQHRHRDLRLSSALVLIGGYRHAPARTKSRSLES